MELVGPIASAAGRPFAHVDGRGLRTAAFDAAVRGRFDGGRWEEGALTRTLRSGGVFLLAHADQLLDDLRQRAARMLLTRTVALTGPSPDDDLVVVGDGRATLLFHVDDHVSAPLQVLTSVRRFPAVIRADVAGRPPLGGPPPFRA
ncbi:MAG TPA: hypothetical protein VFO60_00410 [Candidatus Dormibacteraeota bacterium]|nr:hypothetical protein [Candidatus Dormibacteraeota bacterium]